MRQSKFTILRVLVWLIAGGLVLTTANLVWSANLGNVHRWAWNAIIDTTTNPNPTGLGWLSTNCRNDFDNDGVMDDRCKNSGGTDVTYGLKVNVDNANNTTLGSFNGVDDFVQGCAWSATFGWVCFDQENDPANPYCPSSNPACAQLNPSGVQIIKDATYPFYYLKSSFENNIDSTPDARAIALNLVGTGTEAQGYIGFPFDPASGKTPAQLGLSGNVTSCIGCTWGFGNASCDVCYLVNDGLNDPSIAPNPNIMCTQCTACTTSVIGGSCGTTDNTCAVNSCAKCYTQPGVIVNYYGRCQNNGAFCTADGNCGAGPGQCTYQNAPAEICGWGFNSAKQPADAKAKGLGWVAFNPAVYGKATPYSTAKNGSVLSLGDITQPISPPTGRSSATYLIDAKGTVTHWTSSSSPAYVRQNLGSKVPSFLNFDITSGQAISSIGNVDVNGLIADLGNGFNKYGSFIEEGPRLEDELNSGIVNRVFKYANLTVGPTGGPIEIAAGRNGESGAGIIYVDGNLTINKNITYASTPVNRLKYIPSIVWIVKGDVIIDPAVKTVAGTFIVLGKDTTTNCPAIVSVSNPSASQGCGRFSTGNDRLAPLDLTVYGHVLAKQFLFQRSYSALDSKLRAQPAETFVADGRIQANPPAGMSEISRSLPKFNFSF